MDTPKTRALRGRRRALAAALLFGFIAFASVTGAVLLAAQERSRLRVVAEYNAFQLATSLLRAFDAQDFATIEGIAGLRAFGVYHRWGEALYRFGNAPASVAAQGADERARFEDGIVSFVRFVGGNPMDAQRSRRPGSSSIVPQMGPQMGGGMGMGNARYVYVAYDASVLSRGERLVFLLAAVVVAAILAAFVLLYSLARSLDEYREREARNRELLALGEAARTLAHEIKNPLGVVKIQLALLRKQTGEEARNGLRVIEEETDRLSLLASRVKAFLSADDGVPAAVSVSECLASFSDRYGDRLRVSRDDSAFSSRVLIDPLRLDQILDNLVSNAVESMAGSDFEPPELRAEARRGRVVFSVADRGKGIPEGDSPRVFDLFFTTKPSGAGIGLALSKRYAEAALGAISHHPQQGGGTVFVLDLPEARGENA